MVAAATCLTDSIIAEYPEPSLLENIMSAMIQSQTIWTRIVTPDVGDMPPEAARFLLSLTFPSADQKRYKRLAAKDQCDLELSEREELESLVQANTALMLLQAKARRSLQSQR
jgi:hypothetical protein